ncbi:ABC transporter ATP-binding protein [Roseovarius nanhaiticus]|uniref:ATP-binding cassette, subfamily B/ATP-binding cassette, subfamily B, MsbA n=1 Tax=Roseovarius nanhaiticus TaxID=573024 RepID=A0A1N7ET39_9RHOB|nr:ABC transporter ATP-binding protein [Roseovarius nanhaiticus]SEK67195.1 ATP-binding cassette, subfamily B/ATP-binding cassette, subfamily B, MsbA [Roseovarius nanhaiticus]SIR91250.1 ATP-binding cassette, subfamily B/ATP-binding cassette, subfamily B, MsbA [Roseovarius nanhaiticus]
MSKPPKLKRAPLYSERDKDNLRWLWTRYLRQKAPWLFVVLGMILVQGVVYQQFLSMTESGLRVIFESGSVADLVQVCIVVFVLFAVRGLMSYLVPRVTIWISNDAIFQMRRDLIDHMMRLDLAYFERTKSGEIIQRLVTQTQSLGVFVGQATANAVRDAVTVIIVSGYLIWKNPILFATAVVVLPFIIWVMNYVSDRVKITQGEAETALGEYMNGIEETTAGMRTVKIAGQEGVETDRLMKGTRSIRDLMNRVQITQALTMPSIDLSSAFVYVLVIGGGGYMVLSPQFDMDGAGIITFLLGMVMVFDPARLLAMFFGALPSNLVLLDRIRRLHDEVPSITDKPGATSEFDTRGDIVLEDVHFSYSEDQPLFHGLDMTFKGGQVSAIVGSTGSGKTTILSLLTRLYDTKAGRITIGGQPIDQLKVQALRGAYSVVAQDIVIFNNSIWENIRYVKPEASEEEVWQAAEKAEIADVIRARGGAPVGPKGAQLSGGQKQRIAIARAFLSDAPIILLDEATSALDQATEARIKSALDRLTKGKTCIVVAHRLSSIADADRIYVLEAGQLVEEGRHDQLLKQNRLYAQLYSAQKQGYDKKP